MKLKRISANETEIKFNEETTVFFSYDTPVAAKVGVKYYRTEEKQGPRKIIMDEDAKGLLPLLYLNQEAK